MNSLDWDAVINALERLGIAYRIGGPAQPIAKACSLLHQEPRGLYYYSGEPPGPFAALSESAVICADRDWGELNGNTAILVQGDAQLAFYKLCGALFSTKPEPGIHPTAIIHPEAEIGREVHIGPYAVVGRARIGDCTVLHAHVVVMDGCIIGRRVVVDPGCHLGVTGAVWVWDETGRERIMLPQTGSVRIEDDVFLAAGCAVVRGLFNEATVIGRGTVMAPGCKVGHSVRIGEHCHFANNVSLAGSAVIGDRSFLGSGASVRSGARLAAGTTVGAGAAVINDVREPGLTVVGVPAREIASGEAKKGVPRTRPRAT